VTTLRAYGIRVDLPDGWDGTIYRRESAWPVMHAASFPLPPDDGDFGTKAMTVAPPGGVFIAMPQYDLALAGTGLFGEEGLPIPIGPQELNAKAFARPIPGLVAVQRFFTEAGRPFCVYVVVSRSAAGGDAAAAAATDGDAGPLAQANHVLATVRIEPMGPG
jgi:hypothetical protein